MPSDTATTISRAMRAVRSALGQYAKAVIVILWTLVPLWLLRWVWGWGSEYVLGVLIAAWVALWWAFWLKVYADGEYERQRRAGLTPEKPTWGSYLGYMVVSLNPMWWAALLLGVILVLAPLHLLLAWTLDFDLATWIAESLGLPP